MRSPEQTLVSVVGRRWLREIVSHRIGPAPHYKKLVIFDFDGTLFRSPKPPTSYEDEDTWWLNPQSLNPPLVGTHPGQEMWHPTSLARLQETIKDPDAYVVVMTGRHNSLQPRIQEILDSVGVQPDELITNPGTGNPSGYKRDEMRYLLRQFPHVQEVEFWEDKKNDLKGYQRAVEKAGFRFTPKLVKNYEDELPPYVGVFLTPEAKREILRDFPPIHPEIQADHVTLLFKPTKEQIDQIQGQFKMGKSIPLKITGMAQDDKAQALTVELPGEIQRLGERSPHITISTVTGVAPSYSNDLIQEGTQLLEPKTYAGYLDVGPRIDSPSSKPQPHQPVPHQTEKQRIWLEFLQTETHNPEFGKPGHYKERVLRKTLYDAGGTNRNQVMREWGPYLQGRRAR